MLEGDELRGPIKSERETNSGVKSKLKAVMKLFRSRDLRRRTHPRDVFVLSVATMRI